MPNERELEDEAPADIQDGSLQEPEPDSDDSSEADEVRLHDEQTVAPDPCGGWRWM